MLDSPTEMKVFRPSITWSLLEPCWKSASAMVAVFFAVELEHELLKDSSVGVSISMVQPQPAMEKAPMSKLSMLSLVVRMADPVRLTSPAVTSVKTPGCMRAMVMSSATRVSITALSPEGPFPVCE